MPETSSEFASFKIPILHNERYDFGTPATLDLYHELTAISQEIEECRKNY